MAEEGDTRHRRPPWFLPIGLQPDLRHQTFVMTMSSLVVSLILLGFSQQVSGAYTCPANSGMKLKASQSTQSCSGSTCSSSQCCMMDSAHVCGNSSCTSTQYPDYSATASSACCVANTLCSAVTCTTPYVTNAGTSFPAPASSTAMKNAYCCKITACTDYTCSAGTSARSGTPTCAASGCTNSVCCQAASGYCSSANTSCTSSQTKMGTSMGTTTAQCCVDNIMCSSYVGTASSAVGTHIAGGVLLLILAAVA